MPANQTVASPPARVIHAVAAAGHLTVAIALGAVAVAQASILLPIGLSVPVGNAIGVFGHVDFAAAAAVVLLISAATHCALAISMSHDASSRRARVVQLVALAQASAITVFLVAQLNGLVEAGALVLVYAIVAGASSVLCLQAREVDDRRQAPWPYSAAAALAAVPWGVIALYQIVGIVADSPPAPLVRVMTVLILVLAALAWGAERRWQLGLLTDRRIAVIHAALSLTNGAALLVLAVGISRPSALF